MSYLTLFARSLGAAITLMNCYMFYTMGKLQQTLIGPVHDRSWAWTYMFAGFVTLFLTSGLVTYYVFFQESTVFRLTVLGMLFIKATLFTVAFTLFYRELRNDVELKDKDKL